MSTFFTSNPSTGERLNEIHSGTNTEFDELIAKQKTALTEWKKTDFSERINWSKRIRQVIVDEVDSISSLIATEQGKPKTESIGVEIIPVLDTLKYLEQRAVKELHSRKINHQQLLFSHKKAQLVFEPYGTVLVIAPWNFPFSIPFISALEAMFCGNTVIIKPSPFTAGIGLKIGEILKKAELPKNVIDIFTCENDVAQYAVEHHGINKILFTGSVPTGKKVMVSAAKNLTPVVLELGGKDPAVVSKYADIERAAKGIVWGSLFNSGQVCASVERIYAEKLIAKNLENEILKIMKDISVGNPFSADSEMGPMIHKNQLEIVEAHLNDAVSKGAQIVFGGKRIESAGNFIQPTVITNVNHEMDIMTKETFGPVIAIQEVETFEEGVKSANDSIYGLTASAWTMNKSEIDYFLTNIETGSAMVNDCVYSFGEPSAPWGGVKQSSVGRTHSVFGLLEMVQVKHISTDLSAKDNIWWFPYGKDLEKFMNDAVPALYSNSYLTKIKYTVRLFMNKRFLKILNWEGLIKGLHRWF